MMHIPAIAVLALSVVQSVYAIPEPFRNVRRSTCPPSLVSSTYVTTLTAVQTVPYSCYTRTITTVQSSFPCSGATSFNAATCGPIPECILLATTTVSVPPADSCCATTPTVTVGGACASCQKGCGTSYETVTVTTTPGVAKRQTASSATACTTTLDVVEKLTSGPTKTVYANTATETNSVDCAGCVLSVKNIGGLGPVVEFTTTVTKPVTTATAYACSVSA